MSAANVQLRDEVFTRISLKKTLLGYVFNDFDLEKTWFPYERLEDLGTDHPNGKVYVIGMAPGGRKRQVPEQSCHTGNGGHGWLPTSTSQPAR